MSTWTCYCHGGLERGAFWNLIKAMGYSSEQPSSEAEGKVEQKKNVQGHEPCVFVLCDPPLSLWQEVVLLHWHWGQSSGFWVSAGHTHRCYLSTIARGHLGQWACLRLNQAACISEGWTWYGLRPKTGGGWLGLLGDLSIQGSLRGSDGKVCLQSGRVGFHPWVGRIPWRREWQPTPVFLPGGFHRQRSLAGCSPCGRKELDMTEQLISLIFFFNLEYSGFVLLLD